MIQMLFAAVALASAALQQPATQDEGLRAELAAEVAAFQALLPLRDGPATITAIRVDGLEVIYEMRVDDQVDKDAFRRVLTTEFCTDRMMAETVRRGAVFTYRVTERSGRVIVASIDRCPSQP